MKVAIGILLATVLVLVWRLNALITTSRQQQNQIQELTSKLVDRGTRDALELQEKCALQAEKVFRQLGYKGAQQNGNVDSYQSHYNAKLNKCFMTVESTDIRTTPGTMLITKFLLDAYEQRIYAEYTLDVAREQEVLGGAADDLQADSIIRG